MAKVTLGKKAVRRMSPTTRQVARLQGEIASVARRLKNLVPKISDLEFNAQAITTAKQQPFQPEPVVEAIALLTSLKNTIVGSTETATPILTKYAYNLVIKEGIDKVLQLFKRPPQVIERIFTETP